MSRASRFDGRSLHANTLKLTWGNRPARVGGALGLTGASAVRTLLNVSRTVIPVMLVLIDNYDSFTYNVVQRIGEIDADLEVRVFRNDQITTPEIAALRPSHIIISPGPCTPTEAGISNEVVRHFAGRVPLLGVCLGHQCIADSFGAAIVRAGRLMHGKTSLIRHDGRGIFTGLDNPFQAARYHSLIIEPGTLPDDFQISATTEDNRCEIMAIRHRTQPIDGVQFHPESFLTAAGHKLLANFLQIG